MFLECCGHVVNGNGTVVGIRIRFAYVNRVGSG